jgi:hypothetical protein
MLRNALDGRGCKVARDSACLSPPLFLSFARSLSVALSLSLFLSRSLSLSLFHTLVPRSVATYEFPLVSFIIIIHGMDLFGEVHQLDVTSVA